MAHAHGPQWSCRVNSSCFLTQGSSPRHLISDPLNDLDYSPSSQPRKPGDVHANHLLTRTRDPIPQIIGLAEGVAATYTLRTPSCIHIVVGKRHQSQMNFKITSWKTVPAVAPCLEEIVIRPKLNGRALRLLIPFSWAARFCGLREEHSCYSQRVS